MFISWLDGNSKKISAVYWSDGINLKDIEKYGEECDYLQIWYPKNLSDDIYEKYHELLTYIELEGRWKGNAYSSQMDLSLNVEDILKKFSKTRRYKVRRASQRDGLTVEFLCDISVTELNEFEEYYNRFASQTHELATLDIGKVRSMCESKHFLLAKIRDSEGEVLVIHGYLLDREDMIVALFSSSSFFREDEERKALIGRANCLLHYESMLYFKNNGFKVYDFGGIYLGNQNPHYKSVADFKLSMGGEIVKFQNGFTVPIREAKLIERNLFELVCKLENRDIVLWGYSSFGKYAERLLETRFDRHCKYIIDNKLCQEKTVCSNEQILEKLEPKSVCILVCTDTFNYDRIMEQSNMLKFRNENGIFHLRRE